MKIKKKILLIVGETIVSPVYYIDKKMIYSSYIIWMCMIDILVLVPKIVLINDNVALQGLLQITWIYSINLFRNIGILWFAYWISALLNGAILRDLVKNKNTAYWHV